jgi:glyoxylate reductase
MSIDGSDLGRLKIAVTRMLPLPVMQMLEAHHDIQVNPHDRPMTRDELQHAARDVDALLVTAFDRLDAGAVESLPTRLRIVATYSVGTEHLDLEAARRRGIAVLSTPDVLSDSVAEMAVLLMLGAARRALEGHHLLHGRAWKGWTPTQLVGSEVTGRRMGILGMGRIGRTIARRARGFDMRVHYHNRGRLEPALEEGARHHDTIAGLLAVSDVLVLAAPSTPSTRGVLSAARLALLPEGAIVVNIARGDLVDDDALIAALRSGRIAAAGLDVFNNEPNLHEGYLSLPNVFLQPHQGSSTLSARMRMGQILLDGIDAVLAGRPAPNRLV